MKKDINECERNPCPGACKNVVGSFLCLSSSSINSEKDYESSQENCPPGYQWNDKVQLCIDIDECLELPGACNEDSHLCVNTQGSFTCHELIGPKACPAGFKFDVAAKICRDVDECAEGIHGCLPEVEACRNTEGAYECDIECRKGFVYNRRRGICLDVDECTESLHPCPDAKTHCVNSVGSYECKKVNDSLSSKEKKKNLEASFNDECTSENGRDTCSMGGDNSVDADRDDKEIMTMREEEAGRGEPDVASSDYDERFVTENGKYVRNEPVLTDDRSMINCPQGAFYNRERKSCECLRGFEIDPVNGECRDSRTNSTSSRIRLSDHDFLKPCRPGYKRDSSSQDCRDIDECTEGPGCQDDENCINLTGGYECLKRCTEGWRYDPVTSSCIDIDECTENDPCSPDTHRCVNKNGTYSCELVTSCDNGYRRIYNGSCVDIDECIEGPGCREHELCQNLPGRYDCSPLCVKGWRFDPSTKGCIDVDECQLGLHDCPQTTHRCVNVNGTYDCHLIPPCTIGFRKLFNGSCVDIDECLENLHDCSLTYHRYCVNREGTYECVTRYPECSKGYEYSLRTRNCQDIDECTRGDYRCDAKFAERCVNLPGSWRCERPPSTLHGKKPACPSGYRYDTAGRQCSGFFDRASTSF